MRNKKTLALFMAVMFMVSALFTACGKTDTSSEDTNTATATAAPAESTATAALSGTIGFLDVMPTPEHTGVLKKLISSYEAANPGVKVEYTTVPWEEAFKKVMAMAASKTLPDVNTGSYIELAASESVINLDPYWEKFPYKDQLTEAFHSYKEVMSYKGHMFRIPDGNIYRGIFIRTDWLKEAGIDIETLRNWTWDQYFDVVAKLTDPGKNRFGAAFRGGMGGYDGFMEYAFSELEATDVFPDKLNSNKSILDDPRAVELWENWMSPYMKGYAPKESINWGFKEMVNGFTSGQCGTLIQTPEVITTCKETMQDGTWTVLPFPVKKDAQIHSFTWGPTASYSISANSKDPDLAWTLVEHISSPESNLIYAKEYNVFPNYKSGLADPFFQEGALKGYSDSMLDPKIRYQIGALYLPEWGAITTDIMKNEMQAYLSGAKKAADCIEVGRKTFAEQYEKDVKGQN